MTEHKPEQVQEPREMEELTYENMPLPTQRANTCKAASLSAWVAFLTCSIVIFHALMNRVDSLIVNEQFWRQTEKFMTAYASSKGCGVTENASSALEVSDNVSDLEAHEY